MIHEADALVPAGVRAVALGLLAGVLVGAAGCARDLGALVRTESDVPDERIVGIYPCDEHHRDAVDLDPAQPLTLFVHGCSSSGARFKTLSRVFEANGHQTLCFNYNDRDFLNTSATQLATALTKLQRRLQPQEITVLGHSQGGLIARRALQADLPRPLATREGFTYRLVTVSTPFAGIASSADCGQLWLHALTLSATVGVCLAIAGNKWTEIPPGSDFMNNPTPLVDALTRHLQIVTDERASCRARAVDGTCEVDDFVFGLDEQYSDVVSADPRATAIEVRAGHAAAVGENGIPPRALIEALQQQGVLAATPPARRAAFAALLARIYAL